MVPEEFLKATETLANSEADARGAPSRFQIALSADVGDRLAKTLAADREVVRAGTLLMDCGLGCAMAEGRQKEHARISAEMAGDLIARFPEISEEAGGRNILACVLEHHGGRARFHSAESEICCNADCCRFLTVGGVMGGMGGLRDMPLSGMAQLFLAKAEEKWAALSIPALKEELEPQYRAVKEFFSQFRE